MTFPARLYVLTARAARTAVVLRRGPSNVVCTLGWNLEGDTFTCGQWLRGRLYEHAADISADGLHWGYYTLKAGGIVVCARAPWLKAVDEAERDRVRPGLVLHSFTRLRRDGWTEVVQLGHRLDSCMVFERALPHGWVLRKLAHEQIGAPVGKGCHWEEHELEHAGRRFAHPEWEWADVDGECVVWACGGGLYRARVGVDGPGEPRLLADLNAMQFERRVAPY